MDDLILRETVVKQNRVEFRFETRGILTSYFQENCMFSEYDCCVENVPISILNIAFVSSVLPLIWLTDTTMWVYELDRTFYDAIMRIKYAYQELYPHYPLKGFFVAAKTPYNDYETQRESLLLFSGGIDAHVSYLRIKEQNPILCNIQGWYHEKEDAKLRAAKAERNDILLFAEGQGVPFHFVKSNFAVLVDNRTFHNNIEKQLGDSWWHAFQHSMGFISIAVPLAYLNKVKNIYIASSFSVGQPGKCASYATTDIEFKFAGAGRCIHDAFELSRQDKVRFLVKYQKDSGKPYPVRVCSFHAVNCCECEKCFRTILEIVAENGNVRDFGFDIDGSLKAHFEDVMKRRLYCFDVKGESTKHWPDCIRRMQENYQELTEKEFVDWFLNYDFKKEKRRAVAEYRRKNFFPLVKRKILKK